MSIIDMGKINDLFLISKKINLHNSFIVWSPCVAVIIIINYIYNLS